MSPRLDVGAIRRQQIIDAVRKIIASEGLDAVTIARIAAETDVSQGVVTYHFANKEQILHDALREATQAADARATEMLAVGDDDDPTSAVLKISSMALAEDSWYVLYVAFLAKAHSEDFYRQELAWSDKRYRRALARYVRSDAETAVLLALIKGLALMQMVDREVVTDDLRAAVRNLIDAWLERPPS